MPTINDLNAFVSCYCDWPPNNNLRRYNQFLRGFHKNLANALTFLIRGTGAQAAAEASTGIVLKLEKQRAWNVDVSTPHIRVRWRPTPDLFQIPWSTFDPLVGMIATLLPLQKRNAPGRALVVLLLEKLLPIYFQSAANIERAVAVLEDRLPHLVIRSCPLAIDSPVGQARSMSRSLGYEACRGFVNRSVDGVSFLEMGYKRDVLVPPRDEKRCAQVLETRRGLAVIGPERKSVINFIWFGSGQPSASNTGFANAIQETQKANEGVLVRYWCLQKMVASFRKALSPEVQLLSIEDLLWDARSEFGDALADSVDQILAFYAANRGYAPAKDLISYLMLAIHGGYMFDGNCGVDNWGTFFSAVKEQADPAFVQLEDERPLDLHDPEDDLERLQFDFESATYYKKTDMWALYAPRGCTMFPEIVRRYVGLAESLQLIGGISAASRAFTRVRTVDNAKEVDQGKRAVAGSLGIQSIFWGWSKVPAFTPTTSNWATVDEPPNADRDYTVKCLGINKSHGGTW